MRVNFVENIKMIVKIDIVVIEFVAFFWILKQVYLIHDFLIEWEFFTFENRKTILKSEKKTRKPLKYKRKKEYRMAFRFSFILNPIKSHLVRIRSLTFFDVLVKLFTRINKSNIWFSCFSRDSWSSWTRFEIVSIMHLNL